MTSQSMEKLPSKASVLPTVREHASTENNEQRLEKSTKTKCPTPDCGRKPVFDNLDYSQEVYWMTEDHQTPTRIGCLVRG